jgi:predicted SprT family Zn-dependent metalloprotease
MQTQLQEDMRKMTTQELQSLWMGLKAKHKELTFYTLQFTNGKRSLGVCKISQKIIGISRYHMLGSSYEKVLDTLLHEVAHAIAYANYRDRGHGYWWKRVCLEVGANPNRIAHGSYDIEKPQHKYTLKCSHCNFTAKRHKLPKGFRGSCPKCHPSTFNEKYLLTVTQNW